MNHWEEVDARYYSLRDIAWDYFLGQVFRPEVGGNWWALLHGRAVQHHTIGQRFATPQEAMTAVEEELVQLLWACPGLPGDATAINPTS